MTGRLTVIDHLRAVASLAAAPKWASVVVVGLGLGTAMLEGVGLSLFIPIIESMGSSGDDGGGTVIGRAFERVLDPIPPDWRVIVLIAALCLIIVLKNVMAQLNVRATQYVSGLVAHRLRVRMLEQTVWSCVDYRVDNRLADIVTTLSGHTWVVGTTLNTIYRIFVSLITVTVFLGFMMVVSWPLTLAAIVCFAATALVTRIATRRAQAVGRAVVEENKAFGMRMWENLSSLKLIRACAREEDELSRFATASDQMRRRTLRMSVLWAIPAPITEVLAVFSIAALVFVGQALQLGVASLVAVLALLYRAQRPIKELQMALVSIDSSMAAIHDVRSFLEKTQEPFLRDGERQFEGLRKGLSLRGVGFSYEGGEAAALQGVSFDVPAGTTTAIVGRSGAGKSTLVDLLFRFRDPTQGVILVDGVPLQELRLASWRARVAVMTQDVRLLNDTVAANIAYGKPGASEGEIREAARVAGAAAFIERLPQGYATVVGDAGARLSGGQRQRIALARTVLRDPDVLILDEATNALDNETERDFQRALRQYSRGRTVIVIAHRLSTVEDADQIVALEDGRLVEVGTPAALLQARGVFARLHGVHVDAADVVTN